MKTVLLACAISIGVLHSNATTPCVDPAWKWTDIKKYSDIQFGEVLDAKTGKQLTLLLDAYLPPDSDTRALRPGAVLVHGGSFETGDKTSDDEPELAYNLAIRGFVVVSINYRLDGTYFGLNGDKSPLVATEDARAAVRFMRKNAKAYRIDSDRILMAGDSAGAITALYTGYAKKAQYEGQSGNPGYSSHINLSIPVSGELKVEAFCNTVTPVPSGCQVEGGPKYDYTNDVDGSSFQPPLLMVHGTDDLTVPYVNGKAVYDRAQAAGIKSKLITIPGGKHVPFLQLFHVGTYLQEFMTFIVDALKLGADECPPAPSMVVV